MISVSQADQIIAGSLKTIPGVPRPLAKSYGAILREDIKADRDLPPINKSTLDGIAIKWQAWQKGIRKFRIQGIQPAGTKALSLKSSAHCIEIMTGAVVAKGCDCVIGVENIDTVNGHAYLKANVSCAKGQNIRMRGSDHKKGAVLLKSGAVLKAPQIALAASVGKKTVFVSPKLKVAVVATGDELVDLGRRIKPYQVRLSNSYGLQAAFEETGLFDVSLFHIKDNKKELQVKLRKLLQAFDALVLSGGVSMGKFDFVPEVLQNLKVKVLFHKVQQKPGKPFWYGLYQQRKPVFALPGNPVSTLICAYRYAIPQLMAALGINKSPRDIAALSRSFESKTSLTYFLPVRVSTSDQGFFTAEPVNISGSGDLTSLAYADGFIELPPGPKVFEAGYAARFYRF